MNYFIFEYAGLLGGYDEVVVEEDGRIVFTFIDGSVVDIHG